MQNILNDDESVAFDDCLVDFDDTDIDFDAEKKALDHDTPMTDAQNELRAEISEFREKAKQFQATNDHQFYLIAVFSTKEDKDAFINNAELDCKNNNTVVDGYELAAKCGVSPSKPGFKLAKPFKEK